MKVVLQHKLSMLYLGNDGSWTANPMDARDFGASLKAMDFLESRHMEDVNVVLKFDNTKYDIVLQSFAQSASPSVTRARS